MKKVVVFFTRTNTSKRVAEKISQELSYDLIQITDGKNWNGLFGYIKAGFYSTVGKHVDIQVHGDLEGVDEYIFVAPLWAGGLAPAARTFLKTVPMDKVHLVVTALGSHIEDRLGYRSVHDITDNPDNEDQVINELVNELRNSKEK